MITSPGAGLPALLFTTPIACPATSRAVQPSHCDGSSHAIAGTERTTYSNPKRIDGYNRRLPLIRDHTFGFHAEP